MPPAPILGLLSLVGLFVYTGVGAVVGVIVLRIFTAENDELRDMKVLAGLEKNKTTMAPFGWAVALWPLVIAAAVIVTVVGGGGFLIFVGPVWTCRKIAKYLAATQIKDATVSTEELANAA